MYKNEFLHHQLIIKVLFKRYYILVRHCDTYIMYNNGFSFLPIHLYPTHGVTRGQLLLSRLSIHRDFFICTPHAIIPLLHLFEPLVTFSLA